MKSFLSGWRDDRGQDLIEYGLLAGFIAIVVFGAVTSVGVSLQTWWTGFSDSVAQLF